MDTVALATTGRRTSRLGFGCSSLLGAMTRRESAAALEAAFDAGIRHFDVAPSYGFGAAEGCLGEFLKRHPGQTTVTTKYGIAAPARQSLVGVARAIARPVVRMLPGAKQALLRAAAQTIGHAERPQFLPGSARASLERSLVALKTDHIDLWLLHEVEAADLDGTGSGLLEFLHETVASGKIGAFGIGSDVEKLTALVAAHPAFCAVRQYEWSVLDPLPMDDGSFRLHHRALTAHFLAIHAALVATPAVAARWSERVGVDLRDREKLAELMLAAALVLNPESVLLFSSKKVEHIVRNATLLGRLGQDDATQNAAESFYATIQKERESLFGPSLPASAKIQPAHAARRVAG